CTSMCTGSRTCWAAFCWARSLCSRALCGWTALKGPRIKSSGGESSADPRLDRCPRRRRTARRGAGGRAPCCLLQRGADSRVLLLLGGPAAAGARGPAPDQDPGVQGRRRTGVRADAPSRRRAGDDPAADRGRLLAVPELVGEASNPTPAVGVNQALRLRVRKEGWAGRCRRRRG